MPASTRTPTPGPSQPLVIKTRKNGKKRAMSLSEGEPEERDAKKLKRDETGEDHDSKDKKKRRKKKKKTKKTPVVAEHAKPRSRSTGGSSASLAGPIAGPSNAVSTTTEPSVASAADIEMSEGMESLASGKGKEKATSSNLDADATSNSSIDPQTEIARLTEQLEAKEALLQKHASTLKTIHQSLMCQICLDLMHKPYALAPCGHLACYECLVQWFTAPPPGTPGAAGAGAEAAPANGQPDNANPSLDAPAPQPNYRAYSRKKTCPHCRSNVQDRPVEVWGIKSMVSGLVNSGLLGSLPPIPPLRLPDANIADPWAGIFRKPYNFDYQPHGDPEASIEDMGMYDAEDGGIYRCLDCMHEIWGGICSGCHREYPGHHDSDDSDDEGGHGLWGGGRFMDMDMMDDDEEGYELEDLENDFDDEDDDDDDSEDDPGMHPYNPFNGLMHMAWGMAMGLGRHANHHGEDDGVARVEEVEDGGEDDDDEDDDSEEEYGGSFIDDGDDEVPVNPRRRSPPADVEVIDIEASDDEEVNPRRLRRQGAIIIDVSSDEEEPRASGSRRRARRLFPSDNEDNSAIHTTIRKIAARRRTIDDSEGEDESDAEEQSLNAQDGDSEHEISESEEWHEREWSDEAEDGSIPGPPARLRHLFRDDDENGDMYGEDDSIPGPPARLRHLLEEEASQDEEEDGGYDGGYDSGGI